MRSLHDVRQLLVDSSGSVGERSRARRWQQLRAAFPEINSMSVIDLGGTAEAWLRAPVRPRALFLVNLEPEPDGLPPWIHADQADACNLPRNVLGRGYDLVFSNSVIEHVGGHAQRLRFAAAVHKLAPRHWVQTPYRYFPVEPHWLFPGFQFLPLAVRAEVSRHWPLAHSQSASRDEGLRAAIGVELLSRTEMCHYFPGSQIRQERMAGMVKSLVAVTGSAAAGQPDGQLPDHADDQEWQRWRAGDTNPASGGHTAAGAVGGLVSNGHRTRPG
jgi:hypothetical protein